MGRPFAARFLGSCPECGDDIDPGQLVRYDDDGRVVHNDCDADLTPSEREAEPGVACPSCWTVHAGECM